MGITKYPLLDLAILVFVIMGSYYLAKKVFGA